MDELLELGSWCKTVMLFADHRCADADVTDLTFAQLGLANWTQARKRLILAARLANAFAPAWIPDERGALRLTEKGKHPSIRGCQT